MAKEDDALTHTAEHVLNQALIRVLGCERSYSTHLDSGKGKVDIHYHRDLTPEDVVAVETMANEKIREALPVKEYFLTVAEASRRMPVGKLPPAIAENPETSIRIIEVDGFDLCPCVGTHLGNIRDVGRIRITGHDFTNGRLRVRFRAGAEA